jgi:hypothetical protein
MVDYVIETSWYHDLQRQETIPKYGYGEDLDEGCASSELLSIA